MNPTDGIDIPVAVRNQQILDYVDRGEMEKVAQVNEEYTRIQIREGSFTHQILPTKPAERVDKDLTERLRVIEDLEPDSAGAKWVPLQQVPEGEYMFGQRYEVPMARMLTRKVQKDVQELRNYDHDLRRLFSENGIKDAEAEYDAKFIETCNAIVEDTVGGSVGGVQQETGKIQWTTYSGGLTKENWVQATKMLLRSSTYFPGQDKFVMRNHVALMNEVTARDWMLLDTYEIGDANVAGHFNEGLGNSTPFGMKVITTIKQSIIPENTVYFFPLPTFLGKGYYLQDWETYVKKEGHMVESYSSWYGGFALGNIAAPCRADFDVTP
jgi:hypothetical protein